MIYERCLHFLHWVVSIGLILSIWVGTASAGGAGSQSPPPQTESRPSDVAGAPAIYERVAPAVVLIHATSINPYRFTERVERSIGSGFIIDSEGLVLTNSHVAFGRQSLIVKLHDGTSLNAQLVGADPIFDIAVLRIPKLEQGTLPVVKLGDSDCVRVGEDVLALGSPFGLDQSLTRGIVSAINRTLPPVSFALHEPLIQVDTPINPGNSGGPLINFRGEVVGIATAMVPNAQNIGLAIPINLVKDVLPSLVANGRLVRPWLGFHGQFVDGALQSLLRVPLVVGFMIEVVEPGSPAEQADLRGGALELTIANADYLIGGDIITKLNGIPLTTPENITAALKALTVGATVSLTVFREDRYLDLTYILPERPLLPGDTSNQPTATLVSRKSPRVASRSRF
ncbi:MAG TPA: trypsin-like peptidase domain-containing protein [Blastocatellia bacterium]|nr:trypsin-like peptidase domain-containing protein [Blastocatellia bacterium]